MEEARVLTEVDLQAFGASAKLFAAVQAGGHCRPSLVERALADVFQLQGLDLRLELDAVGWNLNAYHAQTDWIVTDFGLVSILADRLSASFELCGQLVDLISGSDPLGPPETYSS